MRCSRQTFAQIISPIGKPWLVKPHGTVRNRAPARCPHVYSGNSAGSSTSRSPARHRLLPGVRPAPWWLAPGRRRHRATPAGRGGAGPRGPGDAQVVIGRGLPAHGHTVGNHRVVLCEALPQPLLMLAIRLYPEFEEPRHTSASSRRKNKENQGGFAYSATWHRYTYRKIA